MISLLWIASATAHVPVIYITNPSEDWCAVIASALGGDIVMLEAGTYVGPCAIDAKDSDLPGEQTVIQSLDPLDLAVLRPNAAGGSILEVSGDRLILLQLRFEDGSSDAPAVRVGDMRELWVRWSTFDHGDGLGVAQHGDVGELYVTDTDFHEWALPLAIGCTDGTCVAESFEVESSLIVGSQQAIWVGPGSVGAIRDTVVVAGSGAAVTLEGGLGSVELQANLLESEGAALVVQAGPALVRGNLFLGDVVARGDTLSGVDLLGNTVLGLVDLTGWGSGRGLSFVGNALDRVLPTPQGGEFSGNVPCEPVDACFADPAGWDFYPTPESPLRGAGESHADLGPDWCGRVRQATPTSGALEAFGTVPLGPIEPILKDFYDCTLPDEPETTPPHDPPEATGDTGVDDAGPIEADTSGSGCGCGLSPAPETGALLALGLAGLIRTRRQR